MRSDIAVVDGVVTADGILELTERLSLPSGPVRVTVVPMPDLPKDDPFWQRMQGLWAGQRRRGHVPRSTEEIDAERQAIRQQWEERMQRIERTQADAETARKLRKPGS
jgi:hypothetical protein